MLPKGKKNVCWEHEFGLSVDYVKMFTLTAKENNKKSRWRKESGLDKLL